MHAPATAVPLSNAGPTLHDFAVRAQDRSLPESERLELVKALAGWGTPQVRDALLALLKDPVMSIRETAAFGLGWEGNREAVAALRERLEDPAESPAVRAAALQSLAKIGDTSVRPSIVTAVDDADPRVRGIALDALTSEPFASPADRLPLLRRLAEDGALDLLKRCEAIQELGKAKDTAAAPMLMRLLEREPRIPMPLPPPNAPQQQIMQVRFRESRDVRAWSASSLGLIEAREALPLLLKAAADPEDFFLRVTSMTSLIAWKAREAVPVFTGRLTDPYPDVRALAVVGLVKVGDASAGDAALTRLADPVAIVRLEAVTALAELRDPRARAELESLQKRELDSSVQQAIEAALAKLSG